MIKENIAKNFMVTTIIHALSLGLYVVNISYVDHENVQESYSYNHIEKFFITT